MKTTDLCSETVSCLGLGTARLASLGSGYSRKDVIATLEAAAALGVNFIDTADSYGSSDCERLLGELLHETGMPCLIATKAGYPYVDFPPPFRPLNQFGKKLLQFRGCTRRFDGAYLTASIEASLRRLKRDRIDFFLLHDPPLDVLVEGGWEDAISQALEGGKIAHFGVSSPDKEVQSKASRIPVCEILQVPLSIDSHPENPGNLPVIANHVFGSGLDSEKVQTIAENLGVSQRCVLIAYARQRPNVRVVLSGTGNPEHLRANAENIELDLPVSSLETLGND